MVLVRWFLDLVDRCEPDSWSMENVVPVRKRLPEGTPSVVLNSADFGVPQTRRRCYAGAGWEAEPTHTKEEWVSVIDALPDLAGELVGYEPAMQHSERKVGVMANSESYRPNRVLPPLQREITEPSYTVKTSARRIRLEATGSNAKRGADAPLDSPSKTLCGSGNQVGPRIFDHEQEKPVKIRSLTLPETLVLQGFPADYDLSAATTQKARWTMVGNAVPPPVAAAVIRGIQNGVQ